MLSDLSSDNSVLEKLREVGDPLTYFLWSLAFPFPQFTVHRLMQQLVQSLKLTEQRLPAT
jgi:hypothetical protein